MKKSSLWLLVGFLVLNGLFFAWWSQKDKLDAGSDIIDDTTISFVQGNYQEYLDEILGQRGEKDPETWYRMAVSYTKLGKLEQAETYLTKSYAYASSKSTERIMKTVVLMNKEDWEGAWTQINSARSNNNVEMSVIQLLKGIVLVKQRKFLPALEQLQLAEKRDPSAPYTLAMIGEVYKVQNKRKDADVYFQRAENLGYESVNLLSAQAESAWKIKAYDRAVELYAELFEQEVTEQSVYTAYADSLVKTDQDYVALEVLEQATQQFPDHLPFWRLLATIHINQGNTADAISTYEKVEELVAVDKKIEVWIEQMMLYYSLGDTTKSQELEQLVRLNIPQNDIALMVLFANKLYQKSNFLVAKQYIDLVLEKNPKQKQALQVQKKILIGEGLDILRNQQSLSGAPVLEAFPESNEVLWLEALEALDQKDDELLALRLLQQKIPQVTLDQIRLNYMWYLIQEGRSFSPVLDSIEDQTGNIDYINLLFRQQAVLGDNTTLASEYEAKIPGDASSFEKLIRDNIVIEKIFGSYYSD